MTEALWFLFGLMAGGTLGVILMCILQINRLDEEIQQLETGLERRSQKNDYD